MDSIVTDIRKFLSASFSGAENRNLELLHSHGAPTAGDLQAILDGTMVATQHQAKQIRTAIENIAAEQGTK